MTPPHFYSDFRVNDGTIPKRWFRRPPSKGIDVRVCATRNHHIPETRGPVSWCTCKGKKPSHDPFCRAMNLNSGHPHLEVCIIKDLGRPPTPQHPWKEGELDQKHPKTHWFDRQGGSPNLATTEAGGRARPGRVDGRPAARARARQRRQRRGRGWGGAVPAAGGVVHWRELRIWHTSCWSSGRYSSYLFSKVGSQTQQVSDSRSTFRLTHLESRSGQPPC